MVEHEHTQSLINWIGNLVGLGAVVTALIGILPSVGTGLLIVWYAIQIYESRTVQRLIRRWRFRSKLDG